MSDVMKPNSEKQDRQIRHVEAGELRVAEGSQPSPAPENEKLNEELLGKIPNKALGDVLNRARQQGEKIGYSNGWNNGRKETFKTSRDFQKVIIGDGMKTQIWKVEFGSWDRVNVVATNPKDAINKAIRKMKSDGKNYLCRLQDISSVNLEAMED